MCELSLVLIVLTVGKEMSEGLIKASVSLHNASQVGLLKEPVQVGQSNAPHTSKEEAVLNITEASD